MSEWTLLAVPAGFLLDLLAGDPHWLYHPVRLVGKLIEILEKALRRCFPKTEKGEMAAGLLLALLVPALTGGAAWGVLYLAGRVNPWLAFALEILMCYQLFAVRALKDESMKVYRALKKPDLSEARQAVSMIVGRDTDRLDEAGVTKAAVETVAENTSDGVVAPLLYTALGGCTLGCIYKAINTMDSMVGYRNEKYQYFGTAAAKLDDIANFIPARISALLMIVSARLCSFDAKNAWKIFRRDHWKHPSPNSAQTESVCAGALQIQLAGDAVYFGQVHHKPTLGDPIRPVEAEDIPRANELMYVTAWLTLVLCIALRLILIGVIF